MTRTIVLPVNGQSNPMFTLLNPNGDDLHTHLMELNKAHADEEVRKNTGEQLVSELERIRDNIQETQTVNRRDMEEMEATSGTALESYPITAFTERRSATGVQVALEELSGRQQIAVVAMLIGGLGLLYKIIKWLTGRVRSESGGGSGGGGKSFGGKSDDEYKKEIEALEDTIASTEADRAKFDVEGKLDADGKKKLEDDIASYLDARSQFVENCIYGNPSYSKAFSQFVPAFMDRYAKERDLLEVTIDKLRDLVQDVDSETGDKNINAINALAASLDDSQFSPNKWPEFQVFLKACDVGSGGTKTLKEATSELMAKFRKESEKPSRLRPAELKNNGFRKANDDLNAAIRTLDDQEDSGGLSKRFYYFPMEELDKGLDELDKTADELKKIGTAFQERNGKTMSSNAFRAVQAMQGVINKLNQRNTLINMPIMINELLGKELYKFMEKNKTFCKQYLQAAQG
jgi:hypothetical protein